jgi:hypothetical protein
MRERQLEEQAANDQGLRSFCLEQLDAERLQMAYAPDQGASTTSGRGEGGGAPSPGPSGRKAAAGGGSKGGGAGRLSPSPYRSSGSPYLSGSGGKRRGSSGSPTKGRPRSSGGRVGTPKATDGGEAFPAAKGLVKGSMEAQLRRGSRNSVLPG